MTESDASGLSSALEWYATMPDPALSMPAGNANHLNVRRYTGTPAEMRQPALIDNLLCMHLGGAKEVRRWHEGHMDVHSVELGSLTIMPARQSNRWLTRGPIDFAHLLLGPELVGRVALEEFDRDVNDFHLTDVVGFRDIHLEGLFAALLNAIESRAYKNRLYPDSLLVVLIVALLDRYSTLARKAAPDFGTAKIVKGGLAPWRLRSVIDYMIANLGADIGLADLTALTGLSRAQFFRAFKQSMGATPHRYLTDLRLDAAKALLRERDMELRDVAAAVGIATGSAFGTLFQRRFGVTPRAYRKSVW